MAKPESQGITYYPTDVDLDLDDKLAMIIGEFGFKGEIIYTKLLSWIYKNQGYYCKWDEMEQLKFTKRVSYIGNPSVSLVKEIVARCIKWGLFDQTVFESLQVLTSKRIQSTWLDATRKRKNRNINESIWIETEDSAAEPEEVPKKAEFSNKVNKSKEKETKGKEITKAPAVQKNEVVISRRNFKAPDLEELTNYVIQKMGDPKKHRPWPEDKCKNFSAQIFDHYTANGWVQGKSRKPIVDWQAAVRTCIRNEMEKFTANQIPARQEQAQTAPAIHQPQIEKKKLEKPAIELNYLFERYLEDQTKITIISIETLHYDFLKSKALIRFNASEIEEIKKKAIEKDATVAQDERKRVNLMKKFGVLYFFEKQKTEGKQIIFNVDGKETAAA